MVESNYLIRGVEAPDLGISYSGTSHFVNNLVSTWYRLDDMNIVNNRLELEFTPDRHNLPKSLRPGCKYSVTVTPHRDFKLFVKDIIRKPAANDVTYTLIECRPNKEGEGCFFHYDILSRESRDVEGDAISMTTTPQSLQSSGYELLESDDVIGDVMYQSLRVAKAS